MQRSLLSMLLIAFCATGFCQEIRTSNSQCPSFPCVVASISLVNQTQSVYQMPIYTPTTTGFYRVSYFEQALPSSLGIWSFTWNWTDDVKYETYGPFELQPNTYFNGGIPGMRVLAGHPITFTVTGHGGSYNLFANVEQLQ